MALKKQFKNFLLDVDGVLTTGHFLHDEFGKKYKIFGPDDKDALLLLKKYIKISFITSDNKGLKISKKRVENMGFKLKYIESQKRFDWVKKNFDLKETIFMGDGLYDLRLIKHSKMSICPKNSVSILKKYVDYVTKNNGGERAVTEACIFIFKKIFKINIENLI
ncbi:HAD hydrolase family protein [Candidatus Pelagibacter ubique]|nr:HAD hydrolase family protein [Candidatus Pelagibacter ubique]